jgi:hypothetical protein
MKDAHHCTKSGGKSRSGSSRRRQGRDSRPRQQKSIKARETYIVNGLTPDFSHGLFDLCTTLHGWAIGPSPLHITSAEGLRSKLRWLPPLFRQIARHVAHLFVRALARLKRVQLIEEIRRIPASKNRHFAISRDPVGAVAGHTARDRFRSHLLRPRGGGSEDGGEEDGDLHTKPPVTWIVISKHFGRM